MDKLISSQKAILEFIQGRGDFPHGEEFKTCGAIQARKAWEIYRNNYRQSLKRTLQESFRACHKLLGEKDFTQLATSFILSHPLGREPLDQYGEDFPEFLRKSTFDKSLPFLYELACLERVIRRAEEVASLEITYPVHQIWASLMDSQREEEICDLEDRQKLLVKREGEDILFEICPIYC